MDNLQHKTPEFPLLFVLSKRPSKSWEREGPGGRAGESEWQEDFQKAILVADARKKGKWRASHSGTHSRPPHPHPTDRATAAPHSRVGEEEAQFPLDEVSAYALS